LAANFQRGKLSTSWRKICLGTSFCRLFMSRDFCGWRRLREFPRYVQLTPKLQIKSGVKSDARCLLLEKCRKKKEILKNTKWYCDLYKKKLKIEY
jgi:hypothetical protein